MKSKYGVGTQIGYRNNRWLGCGFMWNYDLTFGSAVMWQRSKKITRFYGICLGPFCIGFSVARNEPEHFASK